MFANGDPMVVAQRCERDGCLEQRRSIGRGSSGWGLDKDFEKAKH
jgi:hypothetical protein